MRVTAEFVSKHQAVYVVFAVMMVVMMVVFISNDYDDEHRITLLFRFREITVSPRTSAKKKPKTTYIETNHKIVITGHTTK